MQFEKLFGQIDLFQKYIEKYKIASFLNLTLSTFDMKLTSLTAKFDLKLVKRG